MPFLRRKWKLHEIPSILKYAGSVFNSGWFGIFCAWTGLASNGTGTVVLDLDTHSFSNLRSLGGISSQALLVVKRAEGGSVSFGPGKCHVSSCSAASRHK